MTESDSAAAAALDAGDGAGDERRDFLLIATSVIGATGTALALWPFIDTMNPSADVLALASTEIDLSPIEEGQSITIVWRGKPVFVRRRTAAEIEEARATPLDQLPDPEPDEARAEKSEWLILVGICTHLGCIPLGQKSGDPRGNFGGWFCPCHGSHYDTSGRIRKGPAPENLVRPPYAFLDETTIRIG
ncbi:MAG TPA: ubiquinol-cytochrome c reductase iron-sulfur subunit [Rhodospirillales bacterium]|jgi:ubiquinol-cytochrome c reductase iron-sulfur subunit|nr:ubiquinol-cytochrome c reductase iron-sulfur subunit [Rhodospirillales bacterium]HJO69393.1 ubiquinol-cytochrome c reductase iron-sulfur subunit [Rhodospirillales bacterium]